MSAAFNHAIVTDETGRGVQLHEAGVRAYQEGSAADAESLFSSALELFETYSGADSPHVASVLCDLATVIEDRCDYPKAQRRFERAAAIANQWRNEPDEDLQRLCLRAWSDLGRVQRIQNRYQQARRIFERTLQFAEENFGPDSLEVADALNNLGLLYQAIKRNEEAVDLLRRALAILEANFNDDHPRVVACRENLGANAS
jgi:tetratricopeptide (TPR) repeat protein